MQFFPLFTEHAQYLNVVCAVKSSLNVLFFLPAWSPHGLECDFGGVALQQALIALSATPCAILWLAKAMFHHKIKNILILF